MDFKNSFGLPYEYPDLFEEHMLHVPKKADPPVLDEKYPYINKKIYFRIARVGILFASKTVGFLLLKLLIGVKCNNREILKKYKKELKNGAITICNHVHMWDFLCVMFAIRNRSLFFPAWPKNLTGPNRHLIRLIGGVPIPSQKSGIVEFNHTLNDVLIQGKWLHFYPETSAWFYFDAIRPFKKGVFSYAVKHNKPIIPLVITYRDPRKLFKLIYRKKPLLSINVGEPIFPDLNLSESEAVQKVLHQTRKWMQSTAGFGLIIDQNLKKRSEM
jgi:1-acyl-sn-glycerol-3-phosphate acyltransferase